MAEPANALSTGRGPTGSGTWMQMKKNALVLSGGASHGDW